MTLQYLEIKSTSVDNTEVLFHISAFDRDFFPMPWDQKSWERVFLDGERFLLVLKDDKSLLGFALFDINIVDSFAHLLKIAIDPRRRKEGLGQKLLIKSLETLESRGLKNYFLEVEENNLPAVTLYHQIGFKVVHQKKHFYSNGATALIMTKSSSQG